MHNNKINILVITYFSETKENDPRLAKKTVIYDKLFFNEKNDVQPAYLSCTVYSWFFLYH
jgi:hypothetical protein